MSSPFARTLAHALSCKQKEVKAWLDNLTQKYPAPFYSSVDLRDSGYKIVPVDHNLYPAGFNNICPEDLRTAPQILKAQIDLIASKLLKNKVKRVLVLPESNTQNSYYIENIFYLTQIIRNADFECQVGWYPDSNEPVELTSHTGKKILAYPIQIDGGVLCAGNFVPDVLLLNNDFSSGYPERLDAVTQPILPSYTLGWHSRRKSNHFEYYNQLAGELSQILNIDPWLIQVNTEVVNQVNFADETGIDEVSKAVDRVLANTKKQYEARGISRPPFAFIKNNAGTYGMGIMTAHSGEEVLNLNRRQKNKMSMGKNRSPIQSVIIQEGVPTATIVDRLASEPVIYLFQDQLIGGFLRTHETRGDQENLNSQGMVFKKLCMSDLRDPHWYEEVSRSSTLKEESQPILEMAYGSIARLSAVATGMELAKNESQKKSRNSS